MAQLKQYVAPDGSTWQYAEGTQPEGYTEVKARKAPANKGRAQAANKSRARKAPAKGAE